MTPELLAALPKCVGIGHGIRCLEDPRLVDRLPDAGTPLEVCITSNVLLDLAPAEVARLVEEGFRGAALDASRRGDYLAELRAWG